MVERCSPATPLPLDCHLMIDDPDRWAPEFAEAGAGSVTFHVEAAAAPVRLARDAARRGRPRRHGAASPATPVEPYVDLLPELDMLLVMTVEPGFGGQGFLDVVLPKLRRCRAGRPGTGLDVWLQVDGGVSADTIERCAEAGADVFVAGTAVYGAHDPAARDRRAARGGARPPRPPDDRRPVHTAAASAGAGPAAPCTGRDSHARSGIGAIPNRR